MAKAASVQRVLNIDCWEYLSGLTSGDYMTIFMDPPDNIGLKYVGYVDRRPDYYEWLRLLISKSMKVASFVWISYNQDHDFEIKRIVNDCLKGNWKARQIIWHWTFGHYQKHDFIRSFRPIIRLSCVPSRMGPVGVPTQRMLDGDSRASGELKPPDDVWEFPRVTKGHPEYCDWHPTQHPVGVLTRVISSSGGPVLDLFGGTMASLKACQQLGVSGDACEISTRYCWKSGFPVVSDQEPEPVTRRTR